MVHHGRFIVFLINTVVLATTVLAESNNGTDFLFKNPKTKIGVKINNTKTKCYNISENFPSKTLLEIGKWYEVGIIPTEFYPAQRKQNCYVVEFCECDASRLGWMAEVSRFGAVRKEELNRINDNRTIIRHRYFTVPFAEVWSKQVEGYQGCFEQIASLDTFKNVDHDAMSSEGAMMQLHIVTGMDGHKYLLQMLWGDLISAAIYRDEPPTTDEVSLAPVLKHLTKLRGEQKKPVLCINSGPAKRHLFAYN